MKMCNGNEPLCMRCCTYITGKLLEQRGHIVTAEEIEELRVIVDKLLGPEQLRLALRVDFLVRHPFPLCLGPALDFGSPLFQFCRID